MAYELLKIQYTVIYHITVMNYDILNYTIGYYHVIIRDIAYTHGLYKI